MTEHRRQKSEMIALPNVDTSPPPPSFGRLVLGGYRFNISAVMVDTHESSEMNVVTVSTPTFSNQSLMDEGMSTMEISSKTP